jgi:hypothetical protein
VSESSWLQNEWKIPRRGEVVRDPDGVLGRVLRSEGTFTKRFIWVLNIDGEEMYAREPAEMFQRVDIDTERKFQLERYSKIGYREGALCSFNKKPNVPLEILQMEWNPVRYKMTFCLRNLREFESEVLKTEEEELIPLFDENFPSLEGIFSAHESGLKYRIELGLSKPSRDGWGNNGSAWEFSTEEDAIAEMECWKSRLKIRRVASVLGADWKVVLPCWTIEAVKREDIVFTRVVEVKSFNGSPGYFKSALHAALAMKMLPGEEWLKALFSSQDHLRF